MSRFAPQFAPQPVTRQPPRKKDKGARSKLGHVFLGIDNNIQTLSDEEKTKILTELFSKLPPMENRSPIVMFFTNLASQLDDEVLVQLFTPQSADMKQVNDNLKTILSQVRPNFGQDVEYLDRFLKLDKKEQDQVYKNSKARQKRVLRALVPRLTQADMSLGEDVPSDEEKDPLPSDVKRDPSARRMSLGGDDVTPTPPFYFVRSDAPKQQPESLLGQNRQINTVLVDTLKNLSDTEENLASTEQELKDLEEELEEKKQTTSQEVQTLQNQIAKLKNQVKFIQLNAIDLRGVVDLDNVDTRFIQSVLEEVERQLILNPGLTADPLWNLLFIGTDRNPPIFNDLLILGDIALQLWPLQQNIAPRRDAQGKENDQDLGRRLTNLRIIARVTETARKETPKEEDYKIPGDATWKEYTQARLTQATRYLEEKLRPFLWFSENNRFQRLVNSFKNTKKDILVVEAITPSPPEESKRAQ